MGCSSAGRCDCGSLAIESVVVISTDLQHDASAVQEYNRLVLQHLQAKRKLTISKQVTIFDYVYGLHFCNRTSFYIVFYYIFLVFSSSSLTELEVSSRAGNPSWT